MFKILYISDTHLKSDYSSNGSIDQKVKLHGIHSSLEDDFLTLIDKYLNTNPINLIVFSGDFIAGGDNTSHQEFSQKFFEIVEKHNISKKHIIIVPGNHDIDRTFDPDTRDRYQYFYESWKECSIPYLDGINHDNSILYKDEENKLLIIPINTANWSQSQIVLDDSIQNFIDTISDYEIKKKLLSSFRYDPARISDKQFQILEDELQSIDNLQEYTKIIVQHHHITALDTKEEHKEMPDLLNVFQLQEFIMKYDIRLLIHGHKHTNKIFYHYLSNDSKPHKMLVISGKNLNNEDFFQELNIQNNDGASCLTITKWDKDLKGQKDINIYELFDSENFTNSITLEDSDITKLYNKLCLKAADSKNKNKQFICHLNLKNYTNNRFPIPIMYPVDNERQKLYEKEIDKHVKWWQKESTIYEDITELHGPRLNKYNGYINQIEYIKKQLEKDFHTSKAVATLIEPTKDFQSEERKFPSFISCQFIIREESQRKYLDIIAHFRKHEMRYWWALNIAELFWLLESVKKSLREEVDFGTITTVSNIIGFAQENAFGRSYISSIDYHIDLDPAYVMHQAHSIMCNKALVNSEDELNQMDFIKLLDEIFEDLNSFIRAKNNKDGNAKPRKGLLKLAEYIYKAKDNSCTIQNKFYYALRRLGQTASTFKVDNDFEESLQFFKEDLEKTLECYENLKQSLIQK
jgi:3',5'-cyclic AMP phosphodiesterase CpdA